MQGVEVESVIRFTRKAVKEILTEKAKEMSGQKGLNTSTVNFPTAQAQDAKDDDGFATVSFKVNGSTK